LAIILKIILMDNLLEKIRNTTDYLINEGITNPEIGIILGTGLSKLVDEIKIIKCIDYADIPDFPVNCPVKKF